MDRPVVYFPLTMLIMLLLFVMLLPLAMIVFVGAVGRAFLRVGLTPGETFFLLMMSLHGSAVNIPIAEKVTYEVTTPEQSPLLSLINFSPIRVERRIILAVNLGGAVIPTLISIYLLWMVGLQPGIVISIIAVTAMSYAFSRPVRGVGITMPFFVTPLAATLFSLLFAHAIAGICAYISGTLGALIGADLLRLKDLERIGSGIVSIGGAGVFDGIFLSGVLAVLLS